MQIPETPLLVSRIVLFLLMFSSCSKNESGDFRNNQLVATIILGGGDVVNINSIGEETELGCNTILGSFIEGQDAQNGRIALLVRSGSNPCVSRSGDHKVYSCLYISDSTYSNVSSDPRNELTFTVFRDDYWEGLFSTTCYTETDSVKISGTFKGDPRRY